MAVGALMTIEGYPLLRSDIPTRNGRLYTDGCLYGILNDLQEFIETATPIVTYNNSADGCVLCASMCGVVTKAIIKDQVLYVDIDIIDTPTGRILHNLPTETRLYFCPCGYGDCVEPDETSSSPYKKVVNYTFNYIGCTLADPYFTD